MGFGNIAQTLNYDNEVGKPWSKDTIRYMLSYLKASHKLPSGEIMVEWKRFENSIMLKIRCPKSVQGKIVLQDNYVFEDKISSKNLLNGDYNILLI